MKNSTHFYVNQLVTEGIVLTENMQKQLEMYKNLLLEWNEKINLTAITDEEEIFVKHFVDCLYCAKYITKEDFKEYTSGGWKNVKNQ